MTGARDLAAAGVIDACGPCVCDLSVRETLAGGGYEASSIPDSERKEFRTKVGR